MHPRYSKGFTTWSKSTSEVPTMPSKYVVTPTVAAILAALGVLARFWGGC
jgi:hypothetical protein